MCAVVRERCRQSAAFSRFVCCMAVVNMPTHAGPDSGGKISQFKICAVVVKSGSTAEIAAVCPAPVSFEDGPGLRRVTTIDNVK